MRTWPNLMGLANRSAQAADVALARADDPAVVDRLLFLEGLALGRVVREGGRLPDERADFIEQAVPFTGRMNVDRMADAFRWTEPSFMRGLHEGRRTQPAPLPGLSDEDRVPRPVRVERSAEMSRQLGLEIYLAHAYDQPGGSYKIFGGQLTGAFQLLFRRDLDGLVGIIASHGNASKGFRIGLANAGIRRTKVFISEDVPDIKMDQNRALGSDVEKNGEYYEIADENVSRLVRERPNGYIHGHAYDHAAQAMGVGKIMFSIARAMAAATPAGFDLVCPGGGGGLVSGSGMAAEALGVSSTIYCVETEGADGIGRFIRGEKAVDVRRNRAPTAADGTNVVRVGETNKPVLKRLLTPAQCCAVDEVAVRKATAYAKEVLGLRLEASGALAIAPLLYGGFSSIHLGKRPIVLLLSGRNIEPSLHEEIMAAHGQGRWRRGLVTVRPLF